MKQVECPACAGEGVLRLDRSVRSFSHGGYIQEEIVGCASCDGFGVMEVEEDDDA